MIHYLVPHFILERFGQGQRCGEIEAVGLFVDISGFTAITDALMSHGQYGSELLTDAMGAIFGPMVETIYRQGGFICGFAGDAFTAVCLHGLLSDWPLSTIMERAQQFAAKIVGIKGAIPKDNRFYSTFE